MCGHLSSSMIRELRDLGGHRGVPCRGAVWWCRTEPCCGGMESWCHQEGVSCSEGAGDARPSLCIVKQVAVIGQEKQIFKNKTILFFFLFLVSSEYTAYELHSR